jgi:DNA-binding NtrC family response regulator
MRSSPKTVLIVDDDKLVLSTFKYAIEAHRYAVVLAENGNVALWHLERRPIDLVLLDILMPEKDGLETLREAGERFPSIPIFAMSGGGRWGRHDFLALARKFGAMDTFQKPIVLNELIRTIDTFFEARQQNISSVNP